MNDEIWNEVMEEVATQIKGLLASNSERLQEAYRENIHEAAMNERPLRFGFGFTVNLSPLQKGATVAAKLGYAVRYVDESNPREIDPDADQPELFNGQSQAGVVLEQPGLLNARAQKLLPAPQEAAYNGGDVDPEPVNTDVQAGRSEFYGTTYLYQTPNDGVRQIGVLHDLGNSYIVGWFNDGAKVRVKSTSLPAGPDPKALQKALDIWAGRMHLDVA